MRVVFGCIAALAVTLVAAGPSEAATVGGYDEDGSVHVVDAHGERNRLDVSVYADVVVVRERGSAPLEAEEECRVSGDRAVRCSLFARPRRRCGPRHGLVGGPQGPRGRRPAPAAHVVGARRRHARLDRERRGWQAVGPADRRPPAAVSL
jgi:hypothetical protein